MKRRYGVWYRPFDSWVPGGRLFLLAVFAGSLAVAPAQARQDTLVNAVGMTFVRIEPGEMTAGRFTPACPEPADDDGWTADDHARCRVLAARDARPGFTVRIERPFYIGRYEVTQAEWRAVMGTNPSTFQGDRVEGDADRHPVESVTWADAQAFVARLNALDTTAVHRLPTEMEWEYAARAGRSEAVPWSEIRAQAWIQDVNLGTTHPAGTKAPNAWGLYDVLGNVWEWVEDPYNGRFLPEYRRATNAGETATNGPPGPPALDTAIGSP